MKTIGHRLVAALVRAFPSPFRERFGDEMLGAYLDGRDALADAEAPHTSRWRHEVRTILSLIRALHAERRDAKRRMQAVEAITMHRSHTMRDLLLDLRHTSRSLVARPGFAILAILTLALGIGANTAVFSVLNSVILSPLPYTEPERLVRLYTASTENPNDRNYHPGQDMIDLREQVNAFSSVGIMYTYREVGNDLTTTDGQAVRVRVIPVNAEYFATLGATPLLGRTFTRSEERTDARFVILSHGLWKEFANGDPSIIGRSITLSGVPHEVVGVMRPTFADPGGSDVAAWVPQNLVPGGRNSRGNFYLSAFARLRPGVSLAEARAQLEAFGRRIDEIDPRQGWARVINMVPLHDDMVGSSAEAVYILMGAAALVLLIACLNVANLSLARSVAQTRETAIRTALGAGRTRLVGQRLAESVVLAMAGGLVGSITAYWGVRALLRLSPESLARAESLHVDPVLLAFALAVTVITGLVFGAAPAVRASRSDPQDALHEGSRGNTGGRRSRHARSVLVASQVSVALVLLVGAGLLIRAFAARLQKDPGFDPAGVLTFEVHLPPARYDSATSRVQLHTALQEQVRAIPGVSSVGATSWLPTNGPFHIWGFEYRDGAGAELSVPAQVRVIDGDYLESLGIERLSGRGFGAEDRADAPYAGLISASLARRAFPGRDPLGQTFHTGGNDFTIVGVVDDVANDAAWTQAETAYLSHDQFAGDRNWALTYTVKSSLVPDQLVTRLRGALAKLDPALVVYRPRTMEAVVATHFARDRFVLALMLIFSGVALTLAVIGVYGVLAYLVTQRQHEIGVRMALGAQAGQVRSIVMRQALMVALAGIVLGVLGSIALGGVLQSLAEGVQAGDPMVYLSATAVLGAAVILAGYVPTRRATRVSPLEALRKD